MLPRWSPIPITFRIEARSQTRAGRLRDCECCVLMDTGAMSADAPAAEVTIPPRGSWREALAVFLRPGLTSFGGPVAHTDLGSSPRDWASQLNAFEEEFSASCRSHAREWQYRKATLIERFGADANWSI